MSLEQINNGDSGLIAANKIYNNDKQVAALTWSDTDAGTYPMVRVKDGAIYRVVSGQTVAGTDVPGNSPKWELLGASQMGARSVENIISTYKVRDIDTGLVSYFPDITKSDYFANNKFSKTGNNYVGAFTVFNSRYVWSFAMDVNMAAMANNTNILRITYGSNSLLVYGGGVGIGITHNGVGNGLAYDYGNKKLSIVVIADGYFLNVIANGKRIGSLNIAKRLTSFNVTLYQDNGQTVLNAAFWNRKLSETRAARWTNDANPFTTETGEDRIYPQEGYAISDNFLTGNQYGLKIPAEQNVVKFKDKYFLYFSAANSTPSTFIESGVAVAISSRVDGGYAMYGDDAVIGGARGKAGVNRAMACWAGVKDGSIYVFAASDYNVSNAGGGIFRSMDGLNFTKVGTLPTSLPNMANMGFWPEKVGNYYYGLIEGKAGGATWVIYLVRSLNWENGWEVVQTLPTLQIVSGGMYGGPKLMRSSNNDRWLVVYHANYEIAGNSPTALFSAECKDDVPITWTAKKVLMPIADELNYYSAFNCDQAATPQIIEDGGKTYLSYVLAQNAPDIFCQIRCAKFDGNKEELLGAVPMPLAKNPAKAQTWNKIIASGTSITNGIGSDGGTGISEPNTWRALLQSDLVNSTGINVTVINAGVNGQNTDGMKTNLPGYLAGNTGQIVILEGAINDAQTAGVGLPTATSNTNLSDMVDMVRSSGNTPILTTPMPLNFNVSGVSSNYTAQKRADLANTVRAVGTSKNVKVVDLDTLAGGNVGLLTADGIHPNPQGYVFIKNAIRAAL